MRTVLYPGSFDPVTAGHLDIIRRAAARFEQVIVAVMHNPQKATGAFPVEERIELLKAATCGLDNVQIRAFDGLLVDAARACQVDGVIRGLRSTADTEIELQMARLNRQLGDVETVFMAATPAVMHISANMVREVGRLGGNLRGLVPEEIRPRVAEALRGKR
ncbi:pantetheine-phosphate adenylyltransferase [Eubacteriales bacterium OttesenSCG-928-A19]|nr:pantetheine-phosphate adenylyltransferase [Eubacteriales bacterium OttesenSCG-928-A19]